MSASLRLQVSPRQTEVFIDGYYAGTVDDFDGVFQRLNLEPGEHELELFLPGHRSFTQKVYLQPDNTFRIRHEMVPLSAGEPEPARPVATTPPRASRQAPGRAGTPPDREPRAGAERRESDSEYGTLSLRVQPGDASITIDGEAWEGPAGDERLVVQLAAGRHVVEIRKDGYRSYTTEVNVQAGDTAALNVALTSQ